MDSLKSSSLGRRRRYDSFVVFPPLTDPNNNPRIHFPFTSPAPHPAAPPPLAFSRNHHQDSRRSSVYPSGDGLYYPFQHLPNYSGFDPTHIPTRVSDSAFYHSLPHENPLLPEVWSRNRGGGSTLVEPRAFDDKLGRPNFENFLELGGPNLDLSSRKRPQFGQDNFLRDDFDRRNMQQLRFLDGHVSSGHSISNYGAIVENSQLFGNGLGTQSKQSICKEQNHARNVLSDHGYGKRHHQEYNIPTMDYEHDFELERSVGKGKRKIPNDRNAKYHERCAKQPMQKPSAFSRIRNGLSVWDRLEEKPIALSPPSPPNPLSSPTRMSIDTKANLNIIDLSVKSNALVAKVLDPMSDELRTIKEVLSVEGPEEKLEEKSVDKPIRAVKKKKKKKKKKKGQAKVPIISFSGGSSANNGVGKNSNVSSGSVSVKEEANKEEANKEEASKEASSNLLGSEFIFCNFKRKVKKRLIGNTSGAKEAVKITCQVEDCTVEIPMLEECIETDKFECGNKSEKEINNCISNKDTRDKFINDSHSQVCLKGQQSLDVNSTFTIEVINQTQASIIEVIDSDEDTGKTFDNGCITPLVSDALNIVNVSSQPSEYTTPSKSLPLHNFVTHDSYVNMSENDTAKSIKQVNLEVTGSVKQDLPSINDTLSPDIFISAGSRTLSDINPLNCNSSEKDLEKEGNSQDTKLFLTAAKELDTTGITRASNNEKLPSDRTVKEINVFNLPSFNSLPPSGCKKISRDSSCTSRIDATGTRLEQASLLGPMKTDSPDLDFRDTFISDTQCSENTELMNMSCVYEDNSHRGKCETSESIYESCRTINNHHIISEKTQVLPCHELNKQIPSHVKLTGGKFSRKKSLLQCEIPKYLFSTPNTSAQLKGARTCQSGRHRTWLRANTLLHSDENQKQKHSSGNKDPKMLGKVQNLSYIRKGNSLIRKVAAEPTDFGTASRKCKSKPERNSLREHNRETDNATPPSALLERPNTPPLPPPSKLSDYIMNSCNDFSQLKKVVNSPEPDTGGDQQDGQSKVIAFDSLLNEDTTSSKIDETINLNCVAYVKRNKNQLIATPGPEIGDSSKIFAERLQIPLHYSTESSKAMPSSSSLYYRSKRNQLIRSAFSSDCQQTGIFVCDANLDDPVQQRNILPLKRLDVVHQEAKQSSISLPSWKLGGDKLSQKCIGTFGCHKGLPYLFPWKRAMNWKNFTVNDRTPISSGFSLSMISQKLQCLRKRDTIYKVSTDGFSLRKAGVVSIGGSNLKWSKSIERRSKRASEQATLAVAEVEKTKRERKKRKSTCRNGKNKHDLTRRPPCGTKLKRDDTRERIFRVGSARYRMDSTKRTLIRIPDDDVSSSTNQQPGNNSLKHIVPRRLIIGNNEYVRIGNGNQLVRDPKKLQRILASEKIRWSLHTARLKLAQKRQYCLFFTRFGKCNKNEGKCRYIHDSSKVAICAKFLKGQCSSSNCKLTHKIIPERMPDCSYFLKGLCTNISCLYRHVKVNANAPLCDGFLRGHCANGDECRKKHSYACPLFEATGKCPQGSLCKLRHPKSQSKSRKRKRTKLKSSCQGRYFCSSFGKAGELVSVANSPNDLVHINDIFCSDGLFTEYISLDTDSDNISIENDCHMDSYPGKLDHDHSDMQSCDIDALIKPIQIMSMDDLPLF